MRVLVWKSFGHNRVLAAETPLNFADIFIELSKQMVGWGLDKELDALWAQLGTLHSRGTRERAMLRFVQPHLYTHEVFDGFEFTTLENA